ncbi:tryptophan synthase subunit alpha [Methanocaldococcus infernus]
MRIEEKFKELKEKGEKAFIAFYVGGDPSYEVSLEALKRICKYSDIVEIGIPFSDPVADGLTIQKADIRALNAGMTPIKAFKLVEELNKFYPDVPKVFLTYYNIIFKMGEEEFVKRCKEAGVAGIIVPDLPIEEASSLHKICEKYEVSLIFLVAPTTPDERIKKIVEKGSGFIYVVSTTGITGEREKLAKEAKETVERVKRYTDLPVCVGFGISKKEHVEEICKVADGAIVGSAIVKIVEKNLNDKEKMLKEIEDFVRELKEGTKKKLLNKVS